MESITLSGEVVLHPEQMKEEWQKNIIDQIHKKYIKCDKVNGYICEITRISPDMEMILDTNTANIRCSIKFQAKRILPRIGLIIKCKISMIFQHGIFASINEGIKILIPQNTLDKYTFDQTKQILTKGVQKIEKHDEISVEITETKYSKHCYNCIGKLSI